MTSKVVIFACLLVQAVFGQYLPQQLIPQQLIQQQIIPQCPTKYIQNILPNIVSPLNIAEPCGLPAVVPYPQAPTTVIQDSSVSNNLANALQLLVVSSLLSNTLPFNPPCAGPIVEQFVQQPYINYAYPQVISQAPSCGCGLGGYIY